jgi:hypothetical protein
MEVILKKEHSFSSEEKETILKECLSWDLKKLMYLPLFETVDGKWVSSRGAFLSSIEEMKFPIPSLIILKKKPFLDGPMIKQLSMQILTKEEYDKQLIQNISDFKEDQLLLEICTYLLKSSPWNLGLIKDNLKINGKKISQYYDPKVELFVSILDSKYFILHSESKLWELFQKLGMKSKVDSEVLGVLIDEFEKNPKSISVALSLWKEIGNSGVKRIYLTKKIVPKYKSESEFICIMDALSPEYYNICESTGNFIHPDLQSTLKYLISIKDIQRLPHDLTDSPSFDLVLNHILNIQNRSYSSNKFKSIIMEAYEYMQRELKKNQAFFKDGNWKSKNIIYMNGFFIKPEHCFDDGIDVHPFYKTPKEYSNFKSLFFEFGVEIKPSLQSCKDELKALHCIENPKNLETVSLYLIENICVKDEKEIQFLLTTKNLLVNRNEVLFNDSPQILQMIEDSVHILHPKLTNLNINIPFLSHSIVEKNFETNQKIQNKFLLCLENKIHSKEFLEIVEKMVHIFQKDKKKDISRLLFKKLEILSCLKLFIAPKISSQYFNTLTNELISSKKSDDILCSLNLSTKELTLKDSLNETMILFKISEKMKDFFLDIVEIDSSKFMNILILEDLKNELNFYKFDVVSSFKIGGRVTPKDENSCLPAENELKMGDVISVKWKGDLIYGKIHEKVQDFEFLVDIGSGNSDRFPKSEIFQFDIIQRKPTQNSIEIKIKEELESELLDPITLELLDDPVVASDGYTYSNETYKKLIIQKKESPITREPFHCDPIQNRFAKKLVQFFKDNLK